MEKTHKVKQLVVHTRYECATNCPDCYLQKDMVGDSERTNAGQTSPSLIISSFMERIQDIQFDPKKFDDIELSFMLNTNGAEKEREDILMIKILLYAFEMSLRKRVSEVGIYVNRNMIAAEARRGTLAMIVDTLMEVSSQVTPVNGFKIWISNLIDSRYQLERDNKAVSTISDLLGMNLFAYTITATDKMLVDEYIKRISLLHEILVSIHGPDIKYPIYINVLNVNGKVSAEAIKNALSIHMKLSTSEHNFNVIMDSCISHRTSSTMTDIEHIFPNGSVRNCPYIPYTMRMNNILRQDYCDNQCPIKHGKVDISN